MPVFTRATISVASFACVLASVAVSAPSLAIDAGDAGMGSATAMLAAVTAPLLSVDAKALGSAATTQSARADFSTDGATAGSGALDPQSLSDLVDANTSGETAGEEERCLAASVYYESKGEPLNGQLAVAQVILNRSRSGRFPNSVCDVVRQPGQFSFLRSGEVPDAPAHTDAWHRAVAVAKIARDKLWKEVAPAALYFHARRVSPGWGKVRVASIGNHIFFR